MKKLVLFLIISFSLFVIQCNAQWQDTNSVIAKKINNKQHINSNLKNKAIDNFDEFYVKFYKDTIFQKSRILYPLKGYIKYWDDDTAKEDSWLNNKIVITPKETLELNYKNLKSEILKKDTIVTEKYWLENSGLFIERNFIRKAGKWYLYIYNISNL